MLTNQQIECIELLCLGTKNTIEIAKEIGCTRETVSKWKNRNEEFKAELYKRSHAMETGLIKEAQSLLKRKLGVSVANILEIANSKEVKEETRLKANQYIVDRVLGNTTTKAEIVETKEKEDNGKIDIEKELLNIQKNNKMVKLPLKVAE